MSLRARSLGRSIALCVVLCASKLRGQERDATTSGSAVAGGSTVAAGVPRGSASDDTPSSDAGTTVSPAVSPVAHPRAARRGPAPPRIRVRAEPARVRGGLTRNVVMSFARAHLAGASACWATAVRAIRRGGGGRIVFSLVVRPDGHVRAASVIAQRGNTGHTAGCVTTIVRRWQLPRGRGRGGTIVTLPLVFQRLR